MRRVIKVKVILTAFALLFFVPVLSHATIYYVNDDTGNDTWSGSAESPFATIQAAVDATSATGDAIRVAEGTYSGISEVDPDHSGESYYQVVFIRNKSLTLIGGYDIRDWNTSDPELNVTTIDAQSAGRCITIRNATTQSVTIDGFTITGGDYSDRGNADGVGGSECAITSSDCGGGLYAYDATLILKNSIITENNSSNTNDYSHGGGIYLYNCSSGSEIDNVTVSNNTANTISGGSGAGLFVVNGEDLTITNSEFINNNGQNAGAIYILQPSDSIIIEDCEFSGNTGYNSGGAIGANLAYSGETALYINKVNFNNNSGIVGAGLWLAKYGSNQTKVRFDNLIFSNNDSDSSGNDKSLIHILAITDDFDISMNHITASKNSVSTFLYADDPNSADETASVSVNNTIIDDFTNAFVGNENSGGAVFFTYTGVLFNSVSNIEVTGTGSPEFIAGETIYADPKLDATYHLIKGSPAINAGIDSGITTDIDGDSRPMGSGYDIGADEFIPSGVNAGMLLMLLN